MSTRSDFFQHLDARRSLPRRRGNTPLPMVLGSALVTLCAAVLAFSWQVSQRPTRTPLLTLVGAYNESWDLNAWCSEDHNRITSLGAATMAPREWYPADRLGPNAEDALRETLRQALAGCPADTACVIYVNLHAAVNQAGEPCLIPPSATPFHDGGWLPMRELLSLAQQCQPDQPRSVIFLLECGKLDAWLPAGIVANAFDEKLGLLLEEFNRDLNGWHVAALNSTSNGQRSVAVQTVGAIQGDLFTRFVSQGFAGAADGYGQQGCKDRWITVAELHHYVRDHVSHFASSHFGASQSPTLYAPADAAQQRLCRVPGTALKIDESPVNVPTAKEIAQLNQNHEQLVQILKQRAVTLDPIAWSQTLRLSEAITQATYGGQAAKQQLEPLQHRLNLMFDRWQQSLNRDTQNRARTNAQFSPESITAWQQTLKTPTYDAVAAIFSPAKQAPGFDTSPADGSVDEADIESPTTPESPLLQNLLVYPQSLMWSDPENLQRFATAELGWLELRSQLSAETITLMTAEIEWVAQSRRNCFDLAVANSPEFAAAIASHEQRVETARQRLQIVESTQKALQDACIWIPVMCRWCDQIDWSVIDNAELLAHAQSIPSTAEYCGVTIRAFESATRTFDRLVRVQAASPPAPEDPQLYHSLQRETEQLSRFLGRWRVGLAKTVEYCCEDHADHRRHQLATLLATLHSGPMLLEDVQTQQLHARLRRLMEIQLKHPPASSASNEQRSFVMRGESLQRLFQAYRKLTPEIADTKLAQRPQANGQPDGGGKAFSETPQDAASCTTSNRFDPAWVRQRLEAQPQSRLWIARHFLRMSARVLDPATVVPVWQQLSQAMSVKRDFAFAQRTLDDFWAVPERHDSPYFAWRTRECLDDLERLEPSVREAIQREPQFRTLSAQLEARLAQRLGMTTQTDWANATPVAHLGTQYHARVTAADQARVPNLPPGTLTLLSAAPQPDSEPQPSRGTPVGTLQPTNGSTPKQTTNEVAYSDKLLFGGFRGHHFNVHFTAGSLVDQQVALQRPASTPPASLTVTIEQPPIRELMFVLDCSASMAEPLTAMSAPSSDVQSVVSSDRRNSNASASLHYNELADSKLDAARATLLRLLAQLPSPDWRIGVTLYGHRSAIKKNGLDIVLQEQYYKHFPFPTSLQPYEDVEIILPPGRYGAGEQSLVEQHLGQLRPWGQSPLYLALQRSLEALGRFDNPFPKDLVVITDGRNYQFQPTPSMHVGLQRVQDLARQLNVRIHIVALDGTPAAPNSKRSDFERLTQETGGQLVSQPDDCESLLARLQRVTNPSPHFQFAVGQTTGGTFNAGERIALPQVTAANSPVMLKIDNISHPLRISPGDQFELGYDPQTRRLTARPYQSGLLAQSAMTMADGTPVPAVVGLHRQDATDVHSQDTKSPRQGQLDWPLRFSFQRTDQAPTNRPRWIWTEMRALTLPNEAQSSTTSQLASATSTLGIFRSGQLSWFPGTPCPVGQLSCQGWPVHAKQLHTQLWCTDQKLPTRQIQIGPNDAEPPQQFPLDSDRGTVTLSYHWESGTLEVRLQYHPTAGQSGVSDRTPLGAAFEPCLVRAKLTPKESPTPSADDAVLPLAVAHWYAPDGLTSLHRFQFATTARSSQSPQSPVQLTIVDVATLKANAARLAKPMVVSLPNRTNTDRIAVASTDPSTLATSKPN